MNDIRKIKPAVRKLPPPSNLPPRRRPRVEAPPPRKPALPPALKIGLLVAGAALLLAIIADLRHFAERQRVKENRQASSPAPSYEATAGGAGLWIVDTNRLFKIRLPPGWRRIQPPPGRRLALCYRGPEDQELAIEVTRSPHDDMASLLEEIRSTESGFSVPMNVRESTHAGKPAVWRTVKLSREMVLVLDLLADGRWHNVQLSAPRALFDRQETNLTALIEGYELLPEP